jgi:hypothetical protein
MNAWSVADAVSNLVSCWDKASTFDVLASKPRPYAQKAEDLLPQFNPVQPVFAIAFRRSTLHARWPAEYLTAGSDFVALDGNTRLTVLAIRRRRGATDPGSVGVFLEL